MTYWQWWLGAVALCGVAVAHYLLLRSGLGVSGHWRRVSRWRAQRAVEISDAQIDEITLAVEMARMAAEELGLSEQETAQVLKEARESVRAAPPVKTTSISAVESLLFLLAVLAGGTIAALTTTGFEFGWSLHPQFSAAFGDGVVAAVTLLFGGVLVGAGVTMAGGCTSGHGLVGCSALRPASMLSTLAFFGAGAVTSLIIGALL